MSTLGKSLLRCAIAAVLTVGLLGQATPAVAQAPGAAPPPPPSSDPPPAADPDPNAPPPAANPDPNAPPPGAAPGAPPPGGPPPGAQPPPPPREPWYKDVRKGKNSIFLEGLGAGLWYSLNYERVIAYGIAARIGFAYWSLKAGIGTSSSKVSVLSIPIAVNYIGLSRGSHGLEVGAGATLYYTSAESSSGGISGSASGMTAWGNFNVGYRFQPRRLGFQFRIGFQTLIGRGLSFKTLSNINAIGAIPWGYISVGFTI